MTTIPHPLDAVLERDDTTEPFRVHDDGAAEWAITRLHEIRAAQREKQQFAQAELDRIAVWLAEEQKPLEAKAAYFVSLLEDYARRQREENDRKTVSLPHGKVATRFTQPKFNINDDLFIPWATENAPHLLRFKAEASVTSMREHLLIDGNKVVEPQTGQLVEGVVATAPELSITIKTEGE